MGNGLEYEELMATFKSDMKTLSKSVLLSKWVFESVPYIFKEDVDSFLDVKHKISDLLDVDSCSIVFVGSAALGFSMNPQKEFKPFNESSDIDIAVISHYYFDVAWKSIHQIKNSKQTPFIQSVLEEHRTRLVYWETIATDKILGLLPFGKQWNEAIRELKKLDVFSSRDINFRLYRNHEALRRYHLDNLRKVDTLLYNVVPESINI